jgi:hypothetical protein
MPASATKSRRAATAETVELTALLTLAEVAELLGGVNSKTVTGYIQSGELPAIALGANGGKPYRVEVADFVAFKAARKVRPTSRRLKVQEPAEVVELRPAAREAKVVKQRGTGRKRTDTGLVAA